MLLPLTPANGYAPRVMIFGGGNPATATTEIIDPVRGHSELAVRTDDVPAAHPDERDAPAKRQGPASPADRETMRMRRQRA